MSSAQGTTVIVTKSNLDDAETTAVIDGNGGGIKIDNSTPEGTILTISSTGSNSSTSISWLQDHLILIVTFLVIILLCVGMCVFWLRGKR